MAPEPKPSPVSVEQYRAAFDTYKACMVEYGYDVSEPTISPVDQLQLVYVSLPGSGDADAYEETYRTCYEPFGVIEGSFHATNDSLMAEPLKEAVVSCMDAAGYDVAAAVSYPNMLEVLSSTLTDQALKDAEAALRGCTVSQASTLYPELPVIPLS